MKSLQRFFARLSSLAARSRGDRRLREEVEEHLAQQTADNLRAGMSTAEARRQAVLKFGAIEAIREEYLTELSLPFIWTLLQDLRYALRQLAAFPGFASVVILTIALGVGATTAIYSVVDAVLLHPLPYPQPEQLVRIENDFPGIGARDVFLSVPEWKDFERSGIFQYVAPERSGSVNVTGSSQPTRIQFKSVAANYFALLDVKPEFALSLVLLIAAGLLLHSFWDLFRVRLGFDSENVIAVKLWLPAPNDPSTDIYGTPSQQAQFVRELLRRGQSLPGVKEIAVGSLGSIPLNHDDNLFPLVVEGSTARSNLPHQVEGSSVTPEYFHLLGIPLLRGRLFTETDVENAPTVALVNEAFARTWWPDEDPLGKRMKLGRAADSWTTVVGVVTNARTESLENSNIPQIYLSSWQRTDKDLAIFLRGRLDPAKLPRQVRDMVQSLNNELPVFGAKRLADVVSGSLAQRRFSMEMVLLFALTALLLAGIGVYGTISYIVSGRTRDIGIRIALGAQRKTVLQMVLNQGLKLALVGAAVGLVGALIVSHLMAGLLYGVSPSDPLTFISLTVVLVVVALAACYIPARRAMRVDPIVALREA